MESEAKEWVQKNWVDIDDNVEDGVFAGHIFDTKEQALNFIETLYELGAKKVCIGEVRPYSEMKPERLSADELILDLPEEPQKRQALFDFLNGYDQEPSEHYSESGQQTINVFWDY